MARLINYLQVNAPQEIDSNFLSSVAVALPLPHFAFPPQKTKNWDLYYTKLRVAPRAVNRTGEEIRVHPKRLFLGLFDVLSFFVVILFFLSLHIFQSTVPSFLLALFPAKVIVSRHATKLAKKKV